MSIMQEYDYIFNMFNDEELKKIDEFLENNKKYYLSDLLYKKEVLYIWVIETHMYK